MGGEIARALGGLGLFLFGMIVLTDGLRALAGGALARVLARFTRSPTSGAATGALTTALVQSSSATTVAAVGFVGAGVLSFPQALGIIFGANLGTTFTGWMVALLGFKLKLGLAVMPLILAGALLRLFGSERVSGVGTALAGFGLVFVGIDLLAQGMGVFEGLVTPERFPVDSVGGRVLLVGLGLGFTVLTQSSSAGVASALAAVHAGAIEFPQAAAMVIGMDIGTTATAALATVGGSTPARRTGFAHVIYNLITGLAAFALLDPYVAVCNALDPGVTLREPELALVGFHTFFNGLGLAAVLPFSRPFARLVSALVPDRPEPFTRRLDPRLLVDPLVAVQAIVPILEDLARQTFEILRDEVALRREPAVDRLDLIALAIDETWTYLQRVQTTPERPAAWERHVSALHVLDHLDRLVARARGGRLEVEQGVDAELDRRAAEVGGVLGSLARLAGGDSAAAEQAAEQVWRRLDELREATRGDRVARAARGALEPQQALAQLDGQRRLRRIAYHAWRILHHLRRCRWPERDAAPPSARAIDVLEPE